MRFIFISIFLLINTYAYNVTVSILPQKYFVEKIAKNKAHVNVMVKPGFSPATYSPKTSQMRKLNSSSIYFYIGVPFENAWLDKFAYSNKRMLMIDSSKNIKKLEMLAHEHHEEEHEEKEHEKHEEEIHEDEEHEEHTGLDPHTWTDPSLVKIHAKNILDALIKIDEKNTSFYTKNYNSFIEELSLLDNKIKDILKDKKQSAFMVFHPSWSYFARAYHLEQIAVEKEGKEPKVKEIIALVKEAKEHNIKTLFVSPQFSQNAAKKIAKAINGKVLSVDSLEYKWDENLLNIAKIIKNQQK